MSDEFDDDPFATLTPADDDPQPEDRGDEDAALAALLQQGAQYRTNDTGNGQRFVLYFGEDVMFVPRVGWFTWTGQVWAPDPDEIAVRRKSQQIADLIEREKWHITLPPAQMDAIAREADLLDELGAARQDTGDDGELTVEGKRRVKALEDDLASVRKLKKSLHDLRVSHKRFANTSGNADRMGKMRGEAGTIIARRLDELDANPLDVNTQTGVLRFSVEAEESRRYARFDVLPHAREQLITKLAPVRYDPDAECPEFERFFERIQPDHRIRRFLLRWFALGLTGLIEQKLCYFYGMGANGKSVLVDLMARLAGDYAATAKIESLTGTARRGGGDATPDLVPLIGARMVRAAEPDEGMRWQEGLIKDLTGGEPILVRALHSDFVEVRPIFSLTISGNHKPDIRGTDDGIWRRLLLVPFDVQIPRDEQIPKAELDALLYAERDGVFRLLVDALAEYLEIGLAEPETVTLATAEFRADSDPYGAFLNECCVIGDPGDSLTTRELMLAFHFWMLQAGMGAFKDRTVSLALAERSKRWRSRDGQRFTARKSNAGRFYDGIRFTDLFRRQWSDAPKDTQGRALSTALGSDE